MSTPPTPMQHANRPTLRSFGWRAVVPIAALSAIVAGAAVRFGISPMWGDRIWMTGLVITGIPVVWRTLRGVIHGQFAADVVATLAIVTAIPLDEPLPGLVVVLMQTGGEALERYAEGRASRAVADLEAQAPTLAHRVVGDRVDDIDVDAVAIGDQLLVRPGELIPCDCEVIAGQSHVDASRLTGEPLPISAGPGTHLLSGSVNAEGPLTIRTTALAQESQYARIVELVRTAQASKAPLQRLADQYAVWFTPLTLAVCVVAYLISGDPLRVLAVLVVATPCPLILATPVAVVGGINRAARHGILFRHGAALEQLARVTVAIFDKTGTLTIGRPRVAQVRPAGNYAPDEILRLAGAIEHGSSHLLARMLVQEAESRHIAVPQAENVVEAAGQGISGTVDGHDVAIGGRTYITGRYPAAAADFTPLDSEAEAGQLRAWVAVDGRGAGLVEYADQVRPGLPDFMRSLHELGVRRVILLSGDDNATVRRVAVDVGIDEAHGDLLPGQKSAMVQELVNAGERVLMVGDGTNDAPALSAATVGIALTSGGGGITAEAADAVLLADDPTQIAIAIAVSQRTVHIARQSISAGLGLSAIAMAVAATGHIPPTIGALLQEVIDVAVILNALRAAAELPAVSRHGVSQASATL